MVKMVKPENRYKRENVINIELAGEVDVGQGWFDDVSILYITR